MSDPSHLTVDRHIRVTVEGSVSGSKEKRFKTGCVTCRTRKVRCDEHKPECLNCIRLGVTCDWEGHSRKDTESRGRRRASAACVACRRRKFKCTRLEFDKQCVRCEQKGIECIRETNETPSSPQRPSSAQREAVGPSPLSTALSSDGPRLVSLIERFFATVYHHGYHNFIHKPTFMTLLNENRAPKELSYLMIALALRLGSDTTSDDMLAEADQWADRAASSLLPRIHRGFGAVHVMAMVLLVCYEGARGNVTSNWLCSGQATRMVQFLRLHTFDVSYASVDPASLSPLFSPEALRRLAWATYVLDAIVDSGNYGEHTLSIDAFHIRSPASEQAFVSTQPEAGSSASANAGPSLEAICIQWINMRRRLLHFASKSHSSTDSIEALLTQAETLEDELQTMEVNMPGQFADTLTPYRTQHPQAPLYAFTHAMRHGCHHVSMRTRLSFFTRSPGRSEQCTALRRARIARAELMAQFASNLITYNVNYPPAIAANCYVSLEVLLFDPGRLLTGRDADLRVSYLDPAIGSLLSVIRKAARVYYPARMFQVEASFRMFKCGYIDLLERSDWEAINSSYPYAGQDPTEYNFRERQDEKIERYRRSGKAAAEVAADALLKLGEPATSPPSPVGTSSHLPGGDPGRFAATTSGTSGTSQMWFPPQLNRQTGISRPSGWDLEEQPLSMSSDSHSNEREDVNQLAPFLSQDWEWNEMGREGQANDQGDLAWLQT